MKISIYGLFIALSFVIPFATASGILLYRKIPKMHVFFSAVINFLAASYFAKMFAFAAQGFSVGFFEAGISSLGAALGLMVGILVYRFTYPPASKDIANAYFLAAPLMYSIAKIGCHFAGCCHGIPYDGLFHISYSNENFQTGNLFPVQATESFVFLLIFIICLIVYLKSESKQIIPLVMILSGAGKFLLAYLREEQVGVLISFNQILCFLAVILGIVLLFYKKHKARKELGQQVL